MAFEFKLPDVGEGVAEGELVTWHVAPGDAIEEDQVLAEVETDKALVDVPSPKTGTIRELRFEEGDVVPVGDVLVTIDVEGEEPDAEPETTDASQADAADVEAATKAAESEADATEAEGDETSATGGRVFAAPSARRLARELGVDIETVSGSGPGGRVTEMDVRASAEEAESETTTSDSDSAGETAEAASDAESTETPEESQPAGNGQTATRATQVQAADREQTLATPATRRVANEVGVDVNEVPTDVTRDGEPFVDEAAVREYAEAQQAAQAADTEALAGEQEPAAATGAEPTAEAERERREPYKGVRKTIGDQMERSKYTAPHVTHHDKVDVTGLVEAREKLKPRAEERGIKLTYMPFVMKAVVAALKEYPDLNTSLDEENDEIVYKNYYNVGVATATEAGLMVPVVDDVDRKGLLQLSSELNELVEKARDRSISLDELRGGTFSITNFGAIGGEYATPIINYPETAILGLGAIEERPWVKDGEVVPRKVMTVSLSIDHRVIDGAEAAAFTNTLMEYLEDPTLLLLE
ncbi:2-oxo acid dehydrogenase subunit E2 [Haloarculaceae archaeon H-GB2-1]|nr:2-oxo acid dehydrogenase subunit E2 [Haloarculaceae archaeon H-GB1-1]MEA5388882.1 2-oxo acid dehydrogenase subunit E2 [Haloarculaceae archaeon H-GB11]MEA5406935.1 2-oxo acid dehydrogenase subunit E2 [Haloarculaceae archaeon H-GB2-1]